MVLLGDYWLRTGLWYQTHWLYYVILELIHKSIPMFTNFNKNKFKFIDTAYFVKWILYGRWFDCAVANLLCLLLSPCILLGFTILFPSFNTDSWFLSLVNYSKNKRYKWALIRKRFETLFKTLRFLNYPDTSYSPLLHSCLLACFTSFRITLNKSLKIQKPYTW